MSPKNVTNCPFHPSQERSYDHDLAYLDLRVCRCLLASLQRINHSMGLQNSSGSAGVIAIVAACLVVSSVITFVTNTFGHWPFLLAGIGVGLLAVRAITR